MKSGISLIVPIKNESISFLELAKSIKAQTLQPDEVIFVDGGSTDQTLEIADKFARENGGFKIIKVKRAYPGIGRNIGVENSQNDWVAFTDAGIRLDKNWLRYLADEIKKDSSLDVVYGNFNPVVDNFFKKISVMTYVSGYKNNQIRDEFIASSLLRKSVWEKIGGFVDSRAGEDNIFMSKVKNGDFKIGFAPLAMVYWQVSPDLPSMFRKFVVYSKHNALVGNEGNWQFSIFSQYILVFILLSAGLLYNSWWLLGVVLWLVLRTVKRILPHRFEFGWKILINPLYILSVMFLIVIIDVSAFVGRWQAIMEGKSLEENI